MVQKRIRRQIKEAMDRKPYVGIHASPRVLREKILAEGLKQGKKNDDKPGMNNPRGIQYLEINQEYVRAVLKEGKLRNLLLKLEASIMGSMRVARRHGEKKVDIYLFDSAKAKSENPKYAEQVSRRTFKKVVLMDAEKPARVKPEDLTEIHLTQKELAQINENVETRRRVSKSAKAQYGRKLAHLKRAYARALALKIIKYYQ